MTDDDFKRKLTGQANALVSEPLACAGQNKADPSRAIGSSIRQIHLCVTSTYDKHAMNETLCFLPPSSPCRRKKEAEAITKQVKSKSTNSCRQLSQLGNVIYADKMQMYL